MRFPLYTDFNPAVPIYCATPNEGRVIHRFFDTSPISPSGRYLALTRLPFEDKSPAPGDTADVILIDLQTGEEKIVAQTSAWGSQLGAQVQWGVTDSELYYNEMDTSWHGHPAREHRSWIPYGIHFDPETDERYSLDGPIYHISPDGRFAVSPCLLRTSRTQLGYGVLAPQKFTPENRGAAADDGVFITGTRNGQYFLLTSIEDIVMDLAHLNSPDYADGDFYAFHTKWSPDGRRIMVILRWTPRETRRWWRAAKTASKKTMRKFVVTIDADGTDSRMAISDDLWARGGHHPNWHPDSQHITMNLNLNGDGLRFVSADLDGADIKLLHPTAAASGHPSLHPGGRFLLSDAYPGEAAAYGDGTVPIRLLDLQTGEEHVIARIMSRPAYIGPRKEMRLDAHPAWDRAGKHIIFNGCPDGTRRVFIADMCQFLE